jgi:hypothetical protein
MTDPDDSVDTDGPIVEASVACSNGCPANQYYEDGVCKECPTGYASSAGSESISSCRYHYFRVKYDTYPEETSWFLVDTLSTTVIKQRAVGSVKKKNKALTFKVNFVPGRQYRILLQDQYGDGFCCGHGLGYVSILYQSFGTKTLQTLDYWPAEFGHTRTINFSL